MNELDAVEALRKNLKFSRETAIAYVRARGRCEYCGVDLVMSRQGYAIAEIDHLLPHSKYPELINDSDNFVLSCRTCNGVKRHSCCLVPEEEINVRSMISEKRNILIERVRKTIRDQMKPYDRDWRRATEILHDVWWSSPGKHQNL